ncbi:MAG: DNA-binding response regulator [Candidatus Binatia bacterium]|nr:MAG: DNA-binding response regulator [Candidatus Binatia bacterium]
MARVLVADDHAMFREMLRIALPRGGDLEIVGEAADGRELLEMVSRTSPDVVLLDYKMPHVRNFASLIREVRSAHPGVRVIVLSGFASTEVAARAAEGGASGYVLKSTRLASVVDAVRTVAEGGIWIDPSLPRKVFDAFQRPIEEARGKGSGMAVLTRREREVLSCVAQGISNHEIARRLSISEQTVKTHLTRIFAKLAVKNRLAAALAYYGREPSSRDVPPESS